MLSLLSKMKVHGMFVEEVMVNHQCLLSLMLRPVALTNDLFILCQTSSSTLMAAIQLGIGHSVGSISAKKDQRERDVLLQDFTVVESVFFPR